MVPRGIERHQEVPRGTERYHEVRVPVYSGNYIHIDFYEVEKVKGLYPPVG